MWDTIKKVLNFVSTVFLYSIFVLLIIVGLMVALYFVDHYKSVKEGNEKPPLFGAYVIISGSMEPAIHVYDAVVTMRVDAKDIQKNDVITFISTDPGHSGITVTHRVVGIKETANGSYAYRTKGDNNNVEDDTLVSYDNVLGKVMFRIPLIGHLQKILTSNFGWLLLIVVPCLFIIIGDLVKLIKLLGNKGDKNDSSDDDRGGENGQRKSSAEVIPPVSKVAQEVKTPREEVQSNPPIAPPPNIESNPAVNRRSTEDKSMQSGVNGEKKVSIEIPEPVRPSPKSEVVPGPYPAKTIEEKTREEVNEELDSLFIAEPKRRAVPKEEEVVEDLNDFSEPVPPPSRNVSDIGVGGIPIPRNPNAAILNDAGDGKF